MIAETIHVWGWGWFCGPQWPTADHCIPYYEFLRWLPRLQVTRALDRMEFERALQVVFTTDDATRRRMIEDEITEAYPDGGK